MALIPYAARFIKIIHCNYKNLLKQDVSNVGFKDDVMKLVKNSYGHGTIPQDFAVSSKHLLLEETTENKITLLQRRNRYLIIIN